MLIFERRIKQVSLSRLIGAAIGAILGVLGAYLASMVVAQAVPRDAGVVPFMQITLLMWMGYIGLVVGGTKGEMLNLAAFGGLFGAEKSSRTAFKILDTSVIIDGRIADIAEAGFLEGTLVIPQFVLRELQLVADSADSMKRNRGRRGLDILQRLQKMPDVNVQIIEEDFPHIREVDQKLIELGKLYDCKVVTNDFNLNKVAQLHKVEVLNINELANALRPVVLPGEIMRVFILKEGKEYNQGVAYLDDGTMVVVDNARRLISKTIDITVTSVLQTTAGKMIFGKHDDRQHAVHQPQQEHKQDRAPAPDRIPGPPVPEKAPVREAAASASAAASTSTSTPGSPAS
ncbi:MAG TPA: PIN domain-containing protein [Bryobacteraceae bacterium]